MQRTIEQLFENNEKWAQGIIGRELAFFEQSSKGQTPQFFWIGCSDSRVPAEQIVGVMPGEVFVHRNIANLVVQTDLNCHSVLQFAVDVLKVQHVIVCGHYGCGGVEASMDGQKHGLIDAWLRNIQDIAHENREELARLDEGDRMNRLCELNVLQQRENVARTTTVQEAWERGQSLSLHAWIYCLSSGRVRELAPALPHKSDAFVA